MYIRCILMDIDGTLLDREWKLPRATSEALGRAAASGTVLALATGRPLSALPEELRRFEGIDYAVTSNGAAICRVPSGDRLYGRVMSAEAVDAAMNVITGPLAEGISACEAVSQGEVYCSRVYYDAPERFGASGRNADYVRATRIPLDDIDGFIRAHRQSLDCINFVPLPEYKKKLLETLGRKVKGVSINAGGRLIELADAECGKEKAALRLLDMLRISPEQAAAFGDGDSDAAMLALTGAGVAVGEASDACIAAARFRAPEGAAGVAGWIDRFVREGYVNNFEVNIL